MSDRYMIETENLETDLVLALKGKSVGRVPVWLMRQAGRYLPEYRELRSRSGSFLNLCYDSNLAMEVTMQPIQRFDLDAAIIFSDILVVPDAAGCKVKFSPEKGPILSQIRTAEEINKLDFENLTGRLSPIYEAIKKTRVALSKEKALIGFCGAPWTIASYMIEGGTSRDFLKIRKLAVEEPRTLELLLKKLEGCLASHLIAQISAGANAVQIFDSWAGVLADGSFKHLSFDPIHRICKKVKSMYPEIPIIVFPRLAGTRYTQFSKSKYIDALSIDQTIPCEWAAKNLQGKVAIQGNLDPVLLLSGGDKMVKEAQRICSILNQNKGFVFNLGHGVIKDTPVENVVTLCKLVREQ